MTDQGLTFSARIVSPLGLTYSHETNDRGAFLAWLEAHDDLGELSIMITAHGPAAANMKRALAYGARLAAESRDEE